MAIRTRYAMIDNYIYLYHTNRMMVIPSFMDNVSDMVSPSFSNDTPLQRSAPIYSYVGMGSGRTITFNFKLHRNLMNEINYGVSNITPSFGDDYVDTLVKDIQSAGYPEYDSATKTVSAPVVAVRLGNDIFIKGVVNGQVGVSYEYPILENGKYAVVTLQITVSEYDPYSAYDVQRAGSYRGVTTNLQSYIYRDLKPNS